MSIRCCKCGGTKVTCEAMINPNTKEFDHYTDESFLYGWCDDCKEGTVLTDVDEVKRTIDTQYREFIEANSTEPHYVNCRIVWKDDRKSCDTRIMLSADSGADEEDIFFYCDSLNDLHSLAEQGKEDFIVTECYGFAMLTEIEFMERQVFEYEVKGKTVSITGKEVLAYHGEYAKLKKEDMECCAGYYARHIKYYKEYCNQLLDKSVVSRLLDEEKVMKKGETESFKLQLSFLWYVVITKEDDSLCKPFEYILNAWCLENRQNFDRRYVTLEDALLHCLNGFNENANIPNRYHSTDEYISKQLSQNNDR